MARKRRKLCWDDVPAIYSRTLQEWHAFRPDVCETIDDIEGEGLEGPVTFMMANDGRSFHVVYVWRDDTDDVKTCRIRVLLDEIPRGLGKEVVFQCPSCNRRCTQLAFRPYGLVCAKCGPVTWGSNREGKVARMVRRANTIADKRDNVARHRLVDLRLLVGVHAQQAADALGFARGRIDELHAALHAAGVDPDVGQRA